MLTQEDNLVLQTYCSAMLGVELNHNKLLESKTFQEMKFERIWLKDTIQEIKIDNQGHLLMTLYAMLVVPRELVQAEFQDEYTKAESYLKSVAINTTSTYSSDSSSIEYIRHIRNSIAHARVSFTPNVSVTFCDERQNYKTKKMEKFTTDIPLNKIGMFVAILEKGHIKYIRKRKNS